MSPLCSPVPPPKEFHDYNQLTNLFHYVSLFQELSDEFQASDNSEYKCSEEINSPIKNKAITPKESKAKGSKPKPKGYFAVKSNRGGSKAPKRAENAKKTPSKKTTPSKSPQGSEEKKGKRERKPKKSLDGKKNTEGKCVYRLLSCII